MLTDYFKGFAAHVKRATAGGFKPLQFAQYVSLVKHIEA